MRIRTLYTRTMRPVVVTACLLLAAGTLAQDTYIPASFTPAPTIANCPIFPADNPWNWDVSAAPTDPNSAAYIASISSYGDEYLHADFGGGGEYGIPYVVVGADQPPVP